MVQKERGRKNLVRRMTHGAFRCAIFLSLISSAEKEDLRKREERRQEREREEKKGMAASNSWISALVSCVMSASCTCLAGDFTVSKKKTDDDTGFPKSADHVSCLIFDV